MINGYFMARYFHTKLDLIDLVEQTKIQNVFRIVDKASLFFPVAFLIAVLLNFESY